MNFCQSEKTLDLQKRVGAFMDEHIYPNEMAYVEKINSGDRWQPPELIGDLKTTAKEEGLWNLFLPDVSGLSNLEYAPLAEIMGRVTWASESTSPTMPMTGVGYTAPFGLSLYNDTFPPVTGVPNATHASAMPPTASRNWKNTSGRFGLPKLRQFVIAIGRAPVHATLRAASATAMRPPVRGSR